MADEITAVLDVIRGLVAQARRHQAAQLLRTGTDHAAVRRISAAAD
ncbi:hypothetical protein ACIPJK_26625 [Streptomyces roseus]